MPITSLGHPRIYNQNLNEIVSTFHYQALFSCIQLKIVGFEALDWEVKKLYPLLLNILKYGFRHLTLAITILFIRHVTHYKHRFLCLTISRYTCNAIEIILKFLKVLAKC